MSLQILSYGDNRQRGTQTILSLAQLQNMKITQHQTKLNTQTQRKRLMMTKTQARLLELQRLQGSCDMANLSYLHLITTCASIILLDIPISFLFHG